MPRHFLIAIFVLFILGLQAQMTYHRGYPLRQTSTGNDADTSGFNLTGLQLKDKNYLSLDGILPTDDSTYHALLLTKYKPKGDLAWSRKIKFNDPDLRINPGSISLFQASNDSIYFTFSFFNHDNLRAIAATDKDGENIWVKVLKLDNNEIVTSGSNFLAEGKDSLLYHFANYDRDVLQALIVSRLDKGGNPILAQRLDYFNNDGLPLINNIQGLTTTSDSSFLTTGNLTGEATFPEIYLTIQDKDLNPVLSKIYSAPTAVNLPILSGTKVLQRGNEYVLAGQYFDINPFDLLSSYLGSFVMKVDDSGDVIWSKIIDGNISFINSINGLVVGNDNNIFVSGSVLNQDGELVPFIVSLDGDGEQNWFNTYDRADANFTALGNLFSTEDKGLGYFHSDIDNLQTNLVKTSFIKTDLEGKTTCENISTQTLFADIEISEDTTTISMDTIDVTYESVPSNINPFVEFDVPILSPELVYFCPNAPIDHTFNKEVPGAVSWKWDDESTLSTLRVMDVGQYSVTVTIDDKYCYELCDTNEIKKYTLPTVQAQQGGQVCEGANFTINALGMAEAVPFNYLWNTGENTSSISKNQLGTYGVTVTDNCNETASISVVVDQTIWFGPPAVTVPAVSKVCENAPFTIIAAGSSPAGGDVTYLWSSGENTAFINKTQLGTYSVTVTDRCNKTATASINVTNAIYFPSPIASAAWGGQQVCEGGNILLAASGTSEAGDITLYSWSNGTTGPTTIVTQLQTYTVTVTDVCGKTATANVTPNESVYYKEKPVVVMTNGVQQYCESGQLTVKADASTNNGAFSPFKFTWSNGETVENSNSSTINVEAIGNYKVTVTDECGNVSEASIDIEDPTAFVDSCIKFPKLFFASSSQSDSLYANNRMFGPYSSCLKRDSLDVDELNINDYEFRVYSRWGKEVFSTTNPVERWNGRKEDGEMEFYPSETYVWYATYKIGQFCESKRKGDVTFLR